MILLFFTKINENRNSTGNDLGTHSNDIRNTNIVYISIAEGTILTEEPIGCIIDNTLRGQ